MTRYNKLLPVLFFSLLLISIQAGAQEKDSVKGAYLKADIESVPWEATTFVFDKYPSEIVQIWGNKGNTSLRIQLTKPAVNKQDMLIETDLNSWTDENFNMYMCMANTGSTVITKMDDKWIEGIFKFKGKDKRSGKEAGVYSGRFRIPNPKSFKK